MVPLIIESDNQDQISAYLSDKYLLQNAVAQVRAEGNSISLEAIRYLIDRAKFSVGEKTAVFIIYDGQLITPAGQNALLKTLEESDRAQQFVITTPNHHLLLETIVSRCQVITLKGDQTKPTSLTLPSFINSLKSLGASLLATDEILAGDPKKYLKDLISELRQANRKLPTRKRARIIALALTCLADLERNVNSRLALDHFMLDCRKTIQ